MTKQSMPAVSMLDKKSLEDFKTADKVVLVAFISADDKASNETFTSVANAHRDEYLFGATSDASLAKAEGVKQPAIVLYKTFDEGKNTFEDKFDKEAIETFAKVAAVPLVGEVGPETYAGYMQVSASTGPCFQAHPDIAVVVRSSFGIHLRRDIRGAGPTLQGAQACCREAQGCDQLRYH